MQEVECGLCGRRFLSGASDGAACPSCGFAAAVPVVAAEAPAPSIDVAEAAVIPEAVTAEASGASEEAVVAAPEAEGPAVDTAQAVADTAASAPMADSVPADVSIVRHYQPDAMSEAVPAAMTPPQPESLPDEAPAPPDTTFAAMESAPPPAAEPDLGATQESTPPMEMAEPVAPVIAQEPPPVEAAMPPSQPDQPAYTPFPEASAMPAGFAANQAPPPSTIPPNPYQPVQAPGAVFGYPPQPPVGYPPAPQPFPQQPPSQSPMGYPPAPVNPAMPYGYAPQAMQPGITTPMAPGQQPPFAAPYGAPGGPPTYPGMMMTPPQPPEKRRNNTLIGLIAGVVALALVLGFVGVLAFKGGSHGGVSASATPTATPSAAQILAKVQAFNYTDASFTMSLNFTDQGQTITGTGSGKITKNPSRADIQFAFPITSQGTTYNVQIEVIVDGNTTYTMISGIPGVATDGKWVESATSANSGLTPFDPSQVTNLGGGLSNATLVGSETLDGVAVWHLKGTDTSSSGGSVDIYVRQDDYQPVKADFTETGAIGGSLSVVFTGFNTGITISTPPANQVTQG